MLSRSPLVMAITLALLSTACSNDDAKQAEQTMTKPETTASAAETQTSNPFFAESNLYFKLPPFDKIKDSDYAPAFERGMADQLAEMDAIANNPEAPSFENTFVAMEKTGDILTRVANVFFAMTSANTNDTLEAIRSDMAPKLSAHQDAILLNEKLFQRVKAIYQQRADLNLDPESLRLVEIYYRDFVRAGANLSAEDKEKLKAFNAELASLQTQFSQNVLKEVNASAIVVESKDELAGLSDNVIAGAAEEAKARGMEGKYVIALQNTSGQPTLSSLTNRDLRERIHTASLARGSHGGEFDNRAVLANVAKLRAQRAQLLGYANHAAYSLENQTALTTEAVNKRLATLTPKAVANAQREQADLQKKANAEGGKFQIASWDWAFYSEKVRAERYNFDADQLKPYFEIDNVLQKGVFFAAEKLYGITFKERKDLPTYHEDVRIFEVFEANGDTLALFIFDPYSRASKRGGAWMNAYVAQNKLTNAKPVVANHQNIPKPPAGEPTLLTFDEANTMFHEFGHALHGMFSNVNYPYFAGTSVPRDFVEYPSQVNEMWATWPEVLANYAKHYQTGEAMPKELLDKVLAADKFNQGFATTEYLAASLLDQAWHQLTPEQVPAADKVLDFEAKALTKAGAKMDTVPPRYRSTYFSHIMGGYAAGYYAYIWSEVLDADTVKWFNENGGLTRANGDHFRATLLSRGGSEDAMSIFKTFRGAEPNIAPLLERRGLN
ncbi:M3 family metallopeptidase [Simiduia curdlanivorans]|uniref:M3 family metallopeptidase n=1 Tax=Simiduia curdlanivorans TaxID=1492769 RepID=A0ABV8V8C9_9GAMM|nr:M3 family metallopeptidase [Simiduia curdlanivorans]MDN3639052.1 M3 family metallopeptidase [Simiduia curdlanivorans]